MGIGLKKYSPKKKTDKKEQMKQVAQRVNNGRIRGWAHGFIILFSPLLCTSDNFHNKKLKKNLGLRQTSCLCFYVQFVIKPSQELCTKQYLPFFEDSSEALDRRSLWDLAELHAFSFIGKNRKTIALWRFWLHFFKQMHLSLGTGASAQR